MENNYTTEEDYLKLLSLPCINNGIINNNNAIIENNNNVIIENNNSVIIKNNENLVYENNNNQEKNENLVYENNNNQEKNVNFLKNLREIQNNILKNPINIIPKNYPEILADPIKSLIFKNLNEDSHNIIKINFINNLLYYNSEINVEDINWCSNLNVLYKYLCKTNNTNFLQNMDYVNKKYYELKEKEKN